MKKFLSLVLALLMVFSLVACGGTKEATTTETKETTKTEAKAEAKAEAKEEAPSRDDVVIFIEQTFFNLNPMEDRSYVNTYYNEQVYEPLMRIQDDASLKPVLATSWDVSEDLSEVVFHIREGVKFHNGEELKASDVVFSLETAKEFPAMMSYLKAYESSEALDDYTVKVTLSAPSISFINDITEIYIVNEKFWNEVGGDLKEQSCGTGAYIASSINMNNEIVLEANPDYWQGEASIKKATLRVITDATTAVMALEAGEIDFCNITNLTSFAPLRDSGNYNTFAAPAMHAALIALNNEVAPFDNKLVRQALAYAVDKETMIAVAYEGLAVPSYIGATEGDCFGINLEGCNTYEYDLEKAKALLAEAGYPDGIDFAADFGITMDIIAGGYHEKCAQIFQQSLAQIGCTLELRASETYSADAKSGNYAMVNQGQSYTADMGYLAGNYGSDGIGGRNYSRFQNERVDELFALADKEVDTEKRAEYFHEICQIVTEECPILYTFHKQKLVVWDKDLNAYPHLDNSRYFNLYEWSWN